MATYYWVGGVGNWNATTTTNWATSSGGTGGAGVPTSADDVIFDSASNATAYAVTVGTNANAANVTIAGPASGNVTLTSAATSVINCYGSWTNAATGVAFSTTSGATINFLATSTGQTISTNSVAMGVMAMVFNSATGDWSLSTGLVTTGLVSVILTASAGFNTNGHTCSFGTLQSTGQVARTISLGSSAITLTGSATVINFLGANNLTFNAGTSTITCSAASPFLRASGQTFYNVTFSGTGSGTSTIQGSNTFNNLTQTSRSAGGQRIISVDGNNTITGILTLQTLGTPNATQRTVVWSDVIGTRRTITAAALSGMTDVDFRDIAGAGTAVWAGVRIGNLLNNTGITFTTGVNKYWVLAAGGLWSASTAWALTPGGAAATANFPLAQDTVNIDLTTITSGSTINISVAWQVPTVICTRASGSNTLIMTSGTSSPQLYGNWTSCAGMSFTAPVNSWEFNGQGLTQTVISAGIPFTQGFTVNSPGGTVRLLDAFTTSSGLTHTSGTLDLNNYTLTAIGYNTSSTVAHTLAFGTSGKIVLTGNNSSNVSGAGGNLTVTGSAPLIQFTYSGSSGSRNIVMPALVEAQSISVEFLNNATDTVFIQGTTGGYRNIDFTNFNGSVQTANTPRCFGNFTLGSNVSSTLGTSSLTFAATSGIKTIISNGKTIDFPIIFNGVGGSWQLQDALTLGTTRQLTLTSGALLLNGYTLTMGNFASSATTARALTLSNGSVVITGTPWNTFDATNFTTDATGTIYMSSSSAKTFSGGSGSWSRLINSGIGTLTITGANTFMELGNEVTPAFFVFPASTTTSAYAYSINGTASNLVSLRSSIPGTQYTLAKL